MIDVGKYIEVPFQWRGRSLEGWDCYGLVCTVYREEYGIELPDYLGSYGTETPSQIEEIGDMIRRESRGVWTETREPAEGDVVKLWTIKPAWSTHVGLFVRGSSILMAVRETGTVLVDYGRSTVDGRFWGRRISGFLRHEALA